MATDQKRDAIHSVLFDNAARILPSTGPTVGHVSQQSGSQGSQVPLGASAGASGRPPLPKLRSLPTSVASSRENSPRSAISEAPSIATQAMARLANYRAGSRTFKADRSQRLGLNTGDVVAFRTKGIFLVATPVPQAASDHDAVLNVLAPSDVVNPADPIAHLEVIRQGQWVGFRSVAAGDKLLQARRRGIHRLAFFSSNLGTWEQWEMPELSALESVPWTTVTVTLRNRRLPTCELHVEMVRVGVCSMMPHAAVTPRSLPVPTVAAADEESVGENPNIRRMSGLLVHEWLAFVEKEKRLRNALEVRMEQAIEDAAGLREWAAAQVEGVRRDVEEEVELLLAALSRKSAALEDVQSRLETRVRWGVALLEAKKAAVLGRRVLQAWRATAARAKYCNSVAAKLQERAAVRTKANVIAAWAEYCVEQRQCRQRLRAAVRRMAFLKMQNVWLAWRATMEQRVAEETAEATAYAAVTAHLREWHLRRLVSGWRERARRAGTATRLLQSMASRCDTRLVCTVFTTWKEHIAQQKEALACLEVRTAATRRRAALEAAFDGWRVAVDDTFGGQLQLVHAQRVISRHRGVRSLQAWRAYVANSKAEASRWRQVELFEKRKRLAKALVAWREYSYEQRDNRQSFVRFVHARAERRMQMALMFWRCYAAWKRHAKLAVQHAVQRKAYTTAISALSFWREKTAVAKIQRHRVAMCQRKQRIELLQRAVLALREHAAESIAEREKERKAIGWYAGRLQARALWAMEEAAQRKYEFIHSLETVAARVDRAGLKRAFELWMQAAGQEKAKQVAVYRFQFRRAFYLLKSSFNAWKEVNEEANWEAAAIAKGTARLEASRLRWALSVWRHTTAEEAEEQRQVAFGQRRLAKLRLAAGFGAWRQYTEWSLAVQSTVEEAVAARNTQTLADCLHAWASHTATCAEQRAGVKRLVQTRATAIQAAVLSAWRERAAYKAYQKVQLRRAEARVARVKLATCIRNWRQAVEDSYGEKMRLGSIGLTLAVRNQENLMKRMFEVWRGRATEVASFQAAAEARRAAEASSVLQSCFSTWKHTTATMSQRRAHFVAAMAGRRAERTQALVYAGWKYQAQLDARNALIVLHRIERAATNTCRTAFDAWRGEAKERRQRRTALVRFMQRCNKSAMRAAFAAWRGVAAEKAAQREELKRCLLRKRIAFKQFKQWYWDSFDEDLQATLRAMFEFEADADNGAEFVLEYGDYVGGGGIDADYAAMSGGISSGTAKGPSPVKSLLSSPIRRELEGRRAAARAATFAEAESMSSGSGGGAAAAVSLSELSAKVREAVANAELSPAPPLRPVPAESDCTGSAVLAPLVDWFDPERDPAPVQYPCPLSPVLEASESVLGDTHLDDEDADLSPVAPASEISSAASSAVPTPSSLFFSPMSKVMYPTVTKPQRDADAISAVYDSPLFDNARTPWSALGAAGVERSVEKTLAKFTAESTLRTQFGGLPEAALDMAVTPVLRENPLATPPPGQ